LAASSARIAYAQLRHRHLVHTLRTMSRRQQAAFIMVAAILQPVAIAFVAGVGRTVRALASGEGDASLAWATLAAWLFGTSLVVFALREAIFMLRARAFLRMLPIASWRHFALDLRGVAMAYSFLWLPLAFFAGELWLSPMPAGAKLRMSSTVAGCVAAGMCLQVAFLELHARAHAHRVLAPRVASRLGAWSALAIPIAWRDLRAAIGLRLLLVAGLVAGGAWLAAEGGFCAKANGVYRIECAAAVLALHRIPALVHERLMESLPWLFRLGAAQAMAVAWAMAGLFSLYGVAVAAAAATWTGSCDAVRALAPVLVFGVLLAALAGLALRVKQASTWVGMVAVVAVLYVWAFVL